MWFAEKVCLSKRKGTTYWLTTTFSWIYPFCNSQNVTQLSSSDVSDSWLNDRYPQAITTTQAPVTYYTLLQRQSLQVKTKKKKKTPRPDCKCERHHVKENEPVAVSGVRHFKSDHRLSLWDLAQIRYLWLWGNFTGFEYINYKKIHRIYGRITGDRRPVHLP